MMLQIFDWGASSSVPEDNKDTESKEESKSKEETKSGNESKA